MTDLTNSDNTDHANQPPTDIRTAHAEKHKKITRVLATMLSCGATDLHIQSNTAPMMRIAGRLREVDCEVFTDNEIFSFADEIMDPTSRGELLRLGGCDFSFTFGPARIRVNIFRQQHSLALAIRRLELEIPGFEQLNLPGTLAQIASANRGLVLVAGTTSSGKSTTLAAMIGHINSYARKRIITVEDPIEYIHTSDKSIVAQVEIGPDTPSYTRAIRQSLRQDPDVLLIGEIRDPESVRVALRAADTGHLVFGAIHAGTAVQTVERLIALFDPDEHDLLLTQLAMNMQAIICQRLAEAAPADDCKLLPVVEILRGNAVTRKCILDQRYDGLTQAIVNGDSGMQSFDQHAARLYREKRITGHEALRISSNPEALTMTLRGINATGSGAKIIGQ